MDIEEKNLLKAIAFYIIVALLVLGGALLFVLWITGNIGRNNQNNIQ